MNWQVASFTVVITIIIIAFQFSPSSSSSSSSSSPLLHCVQFVLCVLISFLVSRSLVSFSFIYLFIFLLCLSVHFRCSFCTLFYYVVIFLPISFSLSNRCVRYLFIYFRCISCSSSFFFPLIPSFLCAFVVLFFGSFGPVQLLPFLSII